MLEGYLVGIGEDRVVLLGGYVLEHGEDRESAVEVSEPIAGPEYKQLELLEGYRPACIFIQACNMEPPASSPAAFPLPESSQNPHRYSFRRDFMRSIAEN
jgi:hypothetical protein